MKSNILSLGQLLEKDYDIHMKDNNLSIRDNMGNLITKVPMLKNKMFPLNIPTNLAKCLKACMLQRSIMVVASKIWTSELRRTGVIVQEKDGERFAMHQSSQSTL